MKKFVSIVVMVVIDIALVIGTYQFAYYQGAEQQRIAQEQQDAMIAQAIENANRTIPKYVTETEVINLDD